MGKAFPIFIVGAVLSGLVLSRTLPETSTEGVAVYGSLAAAREIARSAIAAGQDALTRDFGDAQAMRYLNVPSRGGSFDLVATLLPSGIVELVCVGRYGSDAFTIHASLTRQYEGTLPAAVVVDGPTAHFRFGGNRFLISGADTVPPSEGGPHAGGGAPVGAFWSTSKSALRAARHALTAGQVGNVAGLGGDGDLRLGPVPLDLDAFHADAIAAAGHRLEGGLFTGTARFGTPEAPAIVHVSGDTHLAGTVSGYGLLVIEGDLEVAAGILSWEGIVFVQKRGGETLDIRLTGNVAIYGALLLRALPDEADRAPLLNLRHGGTATVAYSAAAIEGVSTLLPRLKAPSQASIVMVERWESAGDAGVIR